MIGEGVVLAGAWCLSVGLIAGVALGAWLASRKPRVPPHARCPQCDYNIRTLVVLKYHQHNRVWCSGSGQQVP